YRAQLQGWPFRVGCQWCAGKQLVGFTDQGNTFLRRMARALSGYRNRESGLFVDQSAQALVNQLQFDQPAMRRASAVGSQDGCNVGESRPRQGEIETQPGWRHVAKKGA